MATESVRHQVVENHLSLSTFLITGAPAELDRLRNGNGRISELLRDAQAKTSDPALHAGLGHIDTAHTYAGGESEETIGAALARVADGTPTSSNVSFCCTTTSNPDRSGPWTCSTSTA